MVDVLIEPHRDGRSVTHRPSGRVVAVAGRTVGREQGEPVSRAIGELHRTGSTPIARAGSSQRGMTVGAGAAPAARMVVTMARVAVLLPLTDRSSHRPGRILGDPSHEREARLRRSVGRVLQTCPRLIAGLPCVRSRRRGRRVVRRIPVLDVLLASAGLLAALVEAGLWWSWGAYPYLLQTLVSVGLAVALLLRRRLVAGSAVATMVLLAIMATNVWTSPVGMGTSPLLLCAPLTVIALTRYGDARWWGLAGVAVAIAGTPLSPALRLNRGTEPLAPFAGWAELGWMLAAHVLVVAVAYLWALRQREIGDRHAAALAEVRDREAARAELATARERNRMARDVHDVVAHSVTLIRVEAATGLAIAESEPDHAQRSLATITQVADEAMTELRALVEVLREPRAEDLSASATLVGAPALLTRMRDTGLDIVDDLPGREALAELDGRLDPGVRLAAVRVLQEAMTNVVKHADHGAPVYVGITIGDQVRVSVRSRIAARGTSSEHGYGVAGLRERVGSVGGSFRAGRHGDEYQLTAELPFRGGNPGTGSASHPGCAARPGRRQK